MTNEEKNARAREKRALESYRRRAAQAGLDLETVSFQDRARMRSTEHISRELERHREARKTRTVR